MKEKKRIIVTGCNAGLGKEILLELIQTCDNCDIIYTCRNQETIDSLQSQLPSNSNRITGLVLDLANLNSVRSFTETLKKSYDQLDYLFLNAGIHKPSFRSEQTIDGIEIHLQVNFISNVLIIIELLDSLKNSPSVIGIVNSNANQPHWLNRWTYRYAISKRRLLEFTGQIHKIYEHIQVKNIAPNFMLTSLHRHKPKIYQSIAPLLNGHLKSFSIVDEARSFLEICFNPEKNNIYYEFGKAKNIYIDHNNHELEKQLSILKKVIPLEMVPTYNVFNTIFFCKNLYVPKTIEEIKKLVLFAKNNNRKIRVTGAKQSYNDIFVSNDISVSLENLTEIIELSETEVTVMAGCKLYQLLLFLYKHDMDLEIMPSNVEGTISGLISTGAHCHYKYGGVFSELVTYMEIVDGNGNELKITDENELTVFRSCAGMLGIITKIKLKVVPKKKHGYKFNYNYIEYDEWKKNIQKYMCEYDHVRYYWVTPNRKYISMDYIHPQEFSEKEKNILKPQINYLEYNEEYKSHRLMKAACIKITSTLVKSKYMLKWLLWVFRFIFKPRLSNFKTLLLCNFFGRSQYFIRTASHEYGNVGEWCVPINNAAEFLTDIEDLFNDKYSALNGLVMMFRYCGKNNSVLLSPPYNKDVLYIEIKSNFVRGYIPIINELSYEITLLGKKRNIKYHLAKHSRAERFVDNLDEATFTTFDLHRKKSDPENIFSNEWTNYHFKR